MVDSKPDPFADDPFDAPAPGGSFPAMRQLVGRLLIIWPTKIERGVPNTQQPGKTQDRMTLDVAVLSGDVITVRETDDGETVELNEPVNPGPDVKVLRGMYSSHAKLVAQLSPRIGGQLAGYLVILPKLPGAPAGRKRAFGFKSLKDAWEEASTDEARAQVTGDLATAKRFVASLAPDFEED